MYDALTLSNISIVVNLSKIICYLKASSPVISIPVISK